MHNAKIYRYDALQLFWLAVCTVERYHEKYFQSNNNTLCETTAGQTIVTKPEYLQWNLIEKSHW